jgi:hypothetical protein
VLVSGPELIEDIRKAPDDVLSLRASSIEVRMFPGTLNSHSRRLCQFIQPEYTLDVLDIDNDYQTDIIRSKLTRNVADTFKEVRDELVRSFDAFIPVHDNGEWQVCS